MLGLQRRPAVPRSVFAGTIGSAAAFNQPRSNSGAVLRFGLVVSLVLVFLYTFVPVVTSSLNATQSGSSALNIETTNGRNPELDEYYAEIVSRADVDNSRGASVEDEVEGGVIEAPPDTAVESEDGVSDEAPAASASPAPASPTNSAAATSPPPSASAAATSPAPTSSNSAPPPPAPASGTGIGAGVEFDLSDPMYAEGDPNAVWPPPQPTPFPARYVSKLVREAKRLGIQVPDVFKRGRESRDNDCPPYIGGALKEEKRSKVLTLEDLAHVTISLVTVSYRTPRSLANGVASWNASGLLELVDQKLMWLNAALDVEKELGRRHGFKVVTADQSDLEWIVPRHRAQITIDSQGDDSRKDQFPFAEKGDDGKQAIWVAPSLLLALHETTADVTIFLEKDYASNLALSRRDLVRQLLAGVAAIVGDTPVVRLRDRDDPDRWALMNCCAGECGNSYSDFGSTCDWSAHLNWLKMFCDPEKIEESSRGNVKKCVDERSAPPPAYPGTSQAPQPIQLLCTSFNHCGWSNNAAMFRKHFWLKVYSSGASLTHDGNGMFEINAMFAGCRAQERIPSAADRLWITPGERPPYFCQLWPGTQVHQEIDG